MYPSESTIGMCRCSQLLLTHRERNEAKRVLAAQSESDESEKEYILEYYSLVREGKMNYIATTAFHDVTGTHPTEPNEFFKSYSTEFRPRKKAKH